MSEDPMLFKREVILGEFESVLESAGYSLFCEDYYDNYFSIKNCSGQTVAAFYDYEIIPQYEKLKRNGQISSEILVSTFFKVYSSEQNMIKKYRTLDSHGKEIVDFVLDKESNRIQELESSHAAVIDIQPCLEDSTRLRVPPQRVSRDRSLHPR